MAFPFDQALLMSPEQRDGATVNPATQLGICQTTSCPPMVKDMDGILREHRWFKDHLRKQTEAPGCHFGLQHPPVGIADEADLVTLKKEGIDFCTLAYTGENEYGGGCLIPDAPLTERGKWLIRSMAEAGIVLDLSHAGTQTARDAVAFGLKVKNLRMVATHVACSSVYNHSRNLPDDVLRELEMVGLVTQTWMLHEKSNSLSAFDEHLEHLLTIVDATVVSLGSDMMYHVLSEEEAKRRFDAMHQKLDPTGQLKVRLPEIPKLLNRVNRLAVLENHLDGQVGPSMTRRFMGENLERFLGSI